MDLLFFAAVVATSGVVSVDLAGRRGVPVLAAGIAGVVLPVITPVFLLLAVPRNDNIDAMVSPSDVVDRDPVARVLRDAPAALSARQVADLAALDEQTAIRKLVALQELGAAGRSLDGRWSWRDHPDFDTSGLIPDQ